MSQTIFITGSSTGLGRAVAETFSSRGWKVFATLRKPKSPEGEALAKLPGVTVLELDVTKPEQIEATAKQVLAAGPVDVVLCNAGYGLAGPLEGMTDEELVRQIDTNLLGAMRTAKAFVGALRERGKGTIITTTSIGGHVTFPFNSAYHATKWALEGFSESLAFELASFGVRVKTVAPGGIATDFAGRSLVLARHPAYADLLLRVTQVFLSPERQKQHSTPEQIADVVWEAATDGRDRVTYLAGADAKKLFQDRLAAGAEGFRAGVKQMFFG